MAGSTVLNSEIVLNPPGGGVTRDVLLGQVLLRYGNLSLDNISRFFRSYRYLSYYFFCHPGRGGLSATCVHVKLFLPPLPRSVRRSVGVALLSTVNKKILGRQHSTLTLLGREQSCLVL